MATPIRDFAANGIEVRNVLLRLALIWISDQWVLKTMAPVCVRMPTSSRRLGDVLMSGGRTGSPSRPDGQTSQSGLEPSADQRGAVLVHPRQRGDLRQAWVK